MLRRLQALYLRYAAVHEDRLRGTSLGPIGRRIGQVERVVRRGDQVEVTGWADATDLRLIWPEGEVTFTPKIPRGDVAARLDGRPDAGFRAVVPASARPLRLSVAGAARPSLEVAISHPAEPAPASAHRRLRRAFVRDLTRAMPAFIRYMRLPSEQSKTAVKRAMGLEITAQGHPLDPAWFSPASQPPVTAISSPEITIILPVYNALPLLKRCLGRVADGTDLPWHLIAVDDASTDPNLGPWLAEWAAARPGQVTHVTLPENRGFVGAVNAGFKVAEQRGGGGPVVLLNSDAMVPAGWASRLTAPLRDAAIASVTPLSNAAEVLSVPTIGPGTGLSPGDVDEIDACAQMLSAVPLPDVPTGVGFCIAMSRAWLARVPRLDPAFGRGYGEEVDWSQKTRALGARHLCQPGLFVEHVGGQSFDSAERALRQRAANTLISQRYPAFDAQVQRFIAEDPLATPRLALGIALAGLRAPRLPVFLAHSLGGGAEVALQAEVAAVPAAVILRVGGLRRWQIEVRVDGQLSAGQTDDLTLIQALLAPVPALDLIYSCGVGDPDPMTLPQALLTLRRDEHGDRIALRLHDYFPISQSYTLLGKDGFSGVPPPETTDPSHSAPRPGGAPAPLAQWQAAWASLIGQAHEVTAFSPASAALLAQAYPDAPIRIRPHTQPTGVRPVVPRGDRIGLLGNINRQKGALILQQAAAANPDRVFVVIGHADSSISLPRNVTLHGAYRPEEVSDLAERYGIGGWLVPAIWPETFSFATREALATGLPVVGFALGAQGEALDAAPNGATVSLTPAETAPARLLACLHLGRPLQEAAE